MSLRRKRSRMPIAARVPGRASWREGASRWGGGREFAGSNEEREGLSDEWRLVLTARVCARALVQAVRARVDDVLAERRGRARRVDESGASASGPASGERRRWGPSSGAAALAALICRTACRRTHAQGVRPNARARLPNWRKRAPVRSTSPTARRRALASLLSPALEPVRGSFTPGGNPPPSLSPPLRLRAASCRGCAVVLDDDAHVAALSQRRRTN